MQKTRKFLRLIQYALLAASLASATLWLITIPTIHYARLEAHLFTGRAIISLSEGCITIMRNAYANPQPPRCFINLPTTPPWNRPPMAWGLWQPHLRTNPRAQLLMLPCWLSMLLTTIPAVILQRKLRRPAPGHCKSCGYNLTGNMSGVCPECGALVSLRITTDDTRGR